MTKRNSFIIILVVLLLIAGGFSAYLMKSKASLEGDLLAAQNEATIKIEAMEKQIEDLKKTKLLSETIENASLKSNPSPEKNSIEESLPTLSENPPPSPTTTEIPKNGPILTVTPEVFDLGSLSKKNGIAVADFELKNTGTSDLIISYAFTSCGCTVSPIKEEKILKPGEIYPMKVTYDPNFYGPQYELGAIEKTITIISNDLENPFYKIKLKANVTA